jgi:ferric-dicitrate binding protein FerR (iron transport regulator)
MNSDEEFRYMDLIDAWLDGEATPEQAAQLRDWLAQDREHIRIFVRETHAHRSLREIAIADQAQIELRPEIQAQRKISTPDNSSRRWWLAAGLAACLLAGSGLLYFMLKSPSAAGVATLESNSGEVLVKRGSQMIPTGQNSVLQADDTVQASASGSAAILYSDGTRISIRPNTDVTLQPRGADAAGGKRLLLARGAIDAVVVKQPAGQPFVMETTQARAVVLGTTFSLQTDKDFSQLDVAEGRVQFSQLKNTMSTVDVSAGGFARFDLGATTFANARRMANGPPTRLIDDHEGELLWTQFPESVPAPFGLSAEQAHGGKKSLRIAYQLKAEDEDPYTEFFHPFKLGRSDRALRFAIFVVSSDEKANWNIQFRLRDRSCWMINFGFLSALKPGWNEIELDLERPPQKQVFGDPAAYVATSADGLLFSICNGSATFFLDDFEIVSSQN